MARKKRRGRPVGSKNKKRSAKRRGTKKRGRISAARKSNRIPLPILERRLLKLARIVKSRQ